MSQKNIEFKIHKGESNDEKKIISSQHSKIKKSMADQLRGEIHLLVQKQHEAEAETWKCYENYMKWKT